MATVNRRIQRPIGVLRPELNAVERWTLAASLLSVAGSILGHRLQLPDEEILRLLPARLPAVTERTITRREVLLRELVEVRQTGLARDLEEVAAGLICFAAYAGETPLGRRIAVSTSIPTDRLDKKREKSIAQGIVQVAQQIRARMRMRA